MLMLHPTVARQLATAHIEDQLRAAAHWRTIRLIRGARRWPWRSAIDAGPRASGPLPRCECEQLTEAHGRDEVGLGASAIASTSSSSYLPL